ncbi:MAG: FHA domain-containing protein [Chloroflexota bacterium]|nr:FHA domain-containing protein [Chloroflexota bacterium]
MKACPNCKNQVEEKAAICPFCGELLLQAVEATRALDNTDFEEGIPRWGTAHFNSRTNLVLQVRGANKTFVFDAGDIEELVIGRVDPDTGEAPAVDLQDAGGVDKGVSRRHAAVIRKDDKLQLIDKGSPNGTYLNGQRLVANQPRILRDGDEIRLGHLVLVVSFEKVSPLSMGRI